MEKEPKYVPSSEEVKKAEEMAVEGEINPEEEKMSEEREKLAEEIKMREYKVVSRPQKKEGGWTNEFYFDIQDVKTGKIHSVFLTRKEFEDVKENEILTGSVSHVNYEDNESGEYTRKGFAENAVFIDGFGKDSSGSQFPFSIENVGGKTLAIGSQILVQVDGSDGNKKWEKVLSYANVRKVFEVEGNVYVIVKKSTNLMSWKEVYKLSDSNKLIFCKEDESMKVLEAAGMLGKGEHGDGLRFSIVDNYEIK